MAPTTSKSWIFANRPDGLATYSGDKATFKLVDRELPKLENDQILVKTTYLSNDPAQRGWISDDIPPERLYIKPVALDSPMHSNALGEVIESTSDKLPKGTVVQGMLGWNEYAVRDAKDCFPVPPPPKGLSISHYLGSFGSTGLTAYYGLAVIGEAKASDKVVVSGAAGATGSMVVQLAKRVLGCREVIGIAGSDEKCKWVESLGADRCLNYKSKTFEEELKEAGKDSTIYFDNVGGSILDSMLGILHQGGVVVACGSISGYNTGEPTVLKNYMQIVTMRLQVRGFIVLDYLSKRGEALGVMMKAVEEGKLKITDENEHVVPTAFEEIPGTWLKLFEGANKGKLITKL